MAWYNFSKNKDSESKRVSNHLEIDDYGRFYEYAKNLLKGNAITKFSNSNAYTFAKAFTEIYTPIDIISDRVSGVKFNLVGKDGKVVSKVPKNIQNLIDRSNATQSFSELIYNIQFNMLASGGVFIYPVFAGNITNKKTESISNIYVLDPSRTEINKSKTIPSNPFLIKEFSEVIQSVDVLFGKKHNIPSTDLMLFTKSAFNPSTDVFQSPLISANKNIDNLSAVYSARYKAYKDNGAAGLLSRKQAPDGDMAQFDTDTRQTMIDEMNKTDGVTGDNNFIAISSIPMEFIKTMGTIRELEPFKETLHDQIAIAGIYGVSKHLLPTVEGTTFENQNQAELSLWQNNIIPSAVEMGKILTKIMYLQDMEFVPDFTSVQILQDNRKTKIETDLIELDLLEKLESLKIENNNIIKKWRN